MSDGYMTNHDGTVCAAFTDNGEGSRRLVVVCDVSVAQSGGFYDAVREALEGSGYVPFGMGAFWSVQGETLRVRMRAFPETDIISAVE